MITLKTANEAVAMLDERLAELGGTFAPVFLNLYQNGHPLYGLSDYFRVSLSREGKVRRTVPVHDKETELPHLVLICDTLLAEYLPGFDFE